MTVVMTMVGAWSLHAVDLAADREYGEVMPQTPVGERSARDGGSGVGLSPMADGLERGARRHDTRPWIHPRMPEHMRSRLDTAFDLAVAHLQRDLRCSGLFSALGSDGVAMLESTLYFVAGPFNEAKICRTAVAYTFVGAAPTVLCRSFAELSDAQAAAILIHEALHHAGLSERRVDRKGLPSHAITRLVHASCGL